MSHLRPHDLLLSTLLRMRSSPLMQTAMTIRIRSKSFEIRNSAILRLQTALIPCFRVCLRCTMLAVLWHIPGKGGAGAGVEARAPGRKEAGAETERRVRGGAEAEKESEAAVESATAAAPAARNVPADTKHAGALCT